MTFLENFLVSTSVGIAIGAVLAYLKQKKDIERYSDDDIRFWKGGSYLNEDTDT